MFSFVVVKKSMEFKPLISLEYYLQSLVKSKLWIKVIVALILGVGLGLLLGPSVNIINEDIAISIGNWLALPGKLFLKLVQMIMIPLIFSSIISGIVSNTGDQLKKLGIGVGVYFVITTIISIAIGVGLALILKPGKYLSLPNSLSGSESISSTNSLSLFSDIPGAISNLLPSNPLASMVSGEMLSIVIFTIIIGIAIAQLSETAKNPILKLLSAIQEICMTVVKWAMRLVPLAVFGLMAQLTLSIGIDSLKGIGFYVVIVILGLVLLLVFYLLIVTIIGKINPFQFLRKIKDVQLLAFSTTSSAAVMPLSLKTAKEKLGINPSISNFLIPIGATVNMDGTAVYQAISTLFIAQIYGIEMTIVNILLVMITVVAASIGTPAIPGGGVVILASVLQSVGIPTEGIVIIIGVERILGMFRVAINVTGDLTACVVFNRWQGSD
jgi:Na+/H+-dicarboxylate symporter